MKDRPMARQMASVNNDMIDIILIVKLNIIRRGDWEIGGGERYI